MADAISGTGVWSVTTWPWPQVFFLEYYTLFFAIKSGTSNLYLYEVYCTTSNVWTATEIQNLGAVANIKYVTVADFNMFYVVTTYARSGNTVTVGTWMKDVGADTVTALPSTNSPTCACIENFNGQAVAGGIVHGSDTSFGNMASNTIAWSEVGRFDFRTGEVEVTPGGPKRFNRTSGYRHLPWGEYGKGQVYVVRRLGNSVIAYGDGGVAKLDPVSTPFSTFTKDKVTGVGITSGSEVDGDESAHCFLGNDNELYMLTANGLRRLGYKEFMEDLSGIVKVSYCPGRKRFYISDGSTGYVLNEWGLYSTDQYVTSAGVYRGTLCGFYKDGGDPEMRVTTDTIDFKQRALKTLANVEVGGNYKTSIAANVMSVKTSWRSDYAANRDTFNELDYLPVNPGGGCFPMVTAREFRITVKNSTYVGCEANVDSIIMRLKLVDKTAIRGLYG